MLPHLINDAKAALGSLAAWYMARASVAVPFVVALGFATAAITLLLAQRFDTITACWIVAAGFTVIGLVAAFLVTIKEHEEAASGQAETEDTAASATDAAARAATPTPIELAGAFLSTPMGPSTLAAGARSIGRNLPLVVMLALVGLLFSAEEDTSAEADTDAARRPKPNGVDDGARPEPSPYARSLDQGRRSAELRPDRT